MIHFNGSISFRLKLILNRLILNTKIHFNSFQEKENKTGFQYKKVKKFFQQKPIIPKLENYFECLITKTLRQSK